jgi:hypothetical protein
MSDIPMNHLEPIIRDWVNKCRDENVPIDGAPLAIALGSIAISLRRLADLHEPSLALKDPTS